MALVVVLLSLAGHAAGSAMLPSLPGLIVAVALSAGLTVAVGARTTPVRLFGFILGVEALLHVIFVISSDHHVGSGPALLVPSSVSVVGHVAAAAAATAVLKYGDDVLASWSALLAAVFGAPDLALPAVASPALPVPGRWDARTVGADAHLSSHSRRGPPAR